MKICSKSRPALLPVLLCLALFASGCHDDTPPAAAPESAPPLAAVPVTALPPAPIPAAAVPLPPKPKPKAATPAPTDAAGIIIVHTRLAHPLTIPKTP